MQSRYRILTGLALLAGLLVTSTAPAAPLDMMVPSDAEVVVKLNIKHVLDSALIKKYALNVIKGVLQQPDAQQVLTATGLDPLKDLDSITVSGAGAKNPRVLIVMRGNFNADKLNTALTEQAKKDGDKLKSSKEGRLTIWEAQNDKNPLFTTVASPTAIVMSTDKTYLVKSVNDEGMGQPSADLRAAVAKVPGKESLWVVGVMTDEVKKQMENNPQTKKYAGSIKAMTAGLTLTDAVELNVQVHTNNADVANELKMLAENMKPFLQIMGQQAGPQLAPVIKEVVDGLKISTEKTTLSVDLKVSEDLIKKAIPKQ